jgi:hypothetical protein
MWKSLAILGVTLLLQIAPLQQQYIAQPSSHYQDAQAQQKQATPTVIINNEDNHQSCEKCNEKDNIAPKDTDDLARKEFIVNKVLVGITILIAIAALIQAIAARLSAEAVMWSERAWLLLEGKDIGDPVLITDDSPDNQRKMPSYCRVALKNCGKTPGFAIDWEFELRVGSSQEFPPSFEIYEKEPRAESPMPFPIGPGWPGQAEARLRPSDFISSTELKDMKEGTKFLWLCGIARYGDVFKYKGFFHRKAARHETRICLRYEFRTNTIGGYWVLGGPIKYNQAT